jgi:hypothetical protein
MSDLSSNHTDLRQHNALASAENADTGVNLAAGSIASEHLRGGSEHAALESERLGCPWK